MIFILFFFIVLISFFKIDPDVIQLNNEGTIKNIIDKKSKGDGHMQIHKSNQGGCCLVDNSKSDISFKGGGGNGVGGGGNGGDELFDMLSTIIDDMDDFNVDELLVAGSDKFNLREVND